MPNLAFLTADARALPYEDEPFYVVVFLTTLTHLPGRERTLAEAFRMLCPQGRLAAFADPIHRTS